MDCSRFAGLLWQGTLRVWEMAQSTLACVGLETGFCWKTDSSPGDLGGLRGIGGRWHAYCLKKPWVCCGPLSMGAL